LSWDEVWNSLSEHYKGYYTEALSTVEKEAEPEAKAAEVTEEKAV